jgi:hypothetical protein
MYFCQRVYNPIKTIKIVFNTYSYIFTLSNTIKIIIICFNIPHFQLLLFWVIISFHDIHYVIYLIINDYMYNL